MNVSYDSLPVVKIIYHFITLLSEAFNTRLKDYDSIYRYCNESGKPTIPLHLYA